MARFFHCDFCSRQKDFADGERGQAWISVEVHDGDDTDPDASFLMSANFCSPECAESYLNAPEIMGTIRFPEPISEGNPDAT